MTEAAIPWSNALVSLAMIGLVAWLFYLMLRNDD